MPPTRDGDGALERVTVVAGKRRRFLIVAVDEHGERVERGGDNFVTSLVRLPSQVLRLPGLSGASG